jgi:ABC-2 type transport system permease protein
VIKRIRTVVLRYVLLHVRAPARLLDLFFWPVMELFLWGFFTVYLRQNDLDPTGKLLSVLINALIFWDILFRSQQAVSLSFMEELWTRNVMNMLISPLKSWEWVLGSCLYGVVKTSVIVVTLFLLAVPLYRFHPGLSPAAFALFTGNLLLMGWAMGLFTTGLLLRWGHSAEALIWGIPFLVQPFSAIFYPLSVYPGWLRPFCLALPSTHVMEGMRRAVETGVFPAASMGAAFGLNLLALAGGTLFYARMLERGRANGQLVRMTG